ncbi:MAG: exodeoxyribonuclease VII large subunit [Mycoplasmatota bacterium]
MENQYLSVGALTKYLKFKFDSDSHLKKVYIKGEISNFKAHTTGHFYFSIKDETSKINALMFSANAKKINFKPVEGSKVLLIGRVSIYESTGNYQIYVDEMIEDGVGNLYKEFELLKQKLNEEGLFLESRKRKIPLMPSKVGVVTAKTGAAVKDIISTIKRRYPICEIYLFPCLVQGELASKDIVKNINLANEYDLDVLIVGRGGGSIEDLWPFNEEIVARAIFESRIPIISAVGHEVDFTIADFVSDLRAPTPTGAAEMAVPNIIELQNKINQYTIRLNENINKLLKLNKIKLDSLTSSFVIKNPLIMYDNKKQKLDLLNENLNKCIFLNIEKRYNSINIIKNSYVLKNPKFIYENKIKELKILNNELNKNINLIIENKKNTISIYKKSYVLTDPSFIIKNNIIKLTHIIEKLNLINPLEVLKRGYSLVYKENEVVNKTQNLKVNDLVNIKLQNGSALVLVKEISDEV